MKDKRIILEGEITPILKKKFYGVAADFDRESKRLLSFYESNTSEHPEFIPIARQLKKNLAIIMDRVFLSTEEYISGKTIEEPEVEYQENKKTSKTSIKETADIMFEDIKFNLQDHSIGYNKEEKYFTTEASDLGLSPRYWNSGVKVPVEKTITLTNKKTGKSMIFTFTSIDANKEQGVQSWNYINKETGIQFIIFND